MSLSDKPDRQLSPQEAAFKLCGGAGERDEKIPRDHPQVIVLRELLEQPKSPDYENRRFTAFLILFSEYTPERVGDVGIELGNEALHELERRT